MGDRTSTLTANHCTHLKPNDVLSYMLSRRLSRPAIYTAPNTHISVAFIHSTASWTVSGGSTVVGMISQSRFQTSNHKCAELLHSLYYCASSQFLAHKQDRTVPHTRCLACNRHYHETTNCSVANATCTYATAAQTSIVNNY
jgi:hypothetical protein